GLRSTSVSGRLAFSGWRTRGVLGSRLVRSRIVTMPIPLSSRLPRLSCGPENRARLMWRRALARSSVQCTPIGIEHAFLQRFRNRRMREDRMHKLFLGRLEVHGDDETLDQFGHFRADEMGAEQLAGLLVEDRLDETLVFAERDGL